METEKVTVRFNKYFLYIGIFIIAFIVHLIGINQIGRTEDEQYKIDFGVIAWDRVFHGDTSVFSWDQGLDHPMVAKYFYGLFEIPQMILIGTRAGPVPVSPYNVIAVETGNYVKTLEYDKTYAVPYEFTYPRIASAACNSVAVLLTVIIANYLFADIFWACLAGLFLLLTPRFIFLGQLVTFESLTACVFCIIVIYFYKLLKSPNNVRLHLLVGLLCGIFFWTRYNNIIVFPFLLGWLFIHYYVTKEKKIFTYKLLLIPLIAFLFGIVIWPITWHDFPKYLLQSLTFQGTRLVGVSFYYWRYLLFTTPIPILFGFCLGLYYSIRKRSYWHLIFLWWLGCAFILYSVAVIQLGGTRYIVMIFPAISILCAYGYSMVLKRKFIYLLIPIILFLVYELTSIYPYYMDYYNQFIGGIRGAVATNHYDFSWWGEGQGPAGYWINSTVPQGSSVGLVVNMNYLFPRTRNDITFTQLDTLHSKADYVVVTYQKLPEEFLQSHHPVYQSAVEGFPLVIVYKRDK